MPGKGSRLVGVAGLLNIFHKSCNFKFGIFASYILNSIPIQISVMVDNFACLKSSHCLKDVETELMHVEVGRIPIAQLFILQCACTKYKLDFKRLVWEQS